MAAENVKVIVRCRPMNKREKDMNCRSVVTMRGCEVQLINPYDKNCPPKQFTFDSVYGVNSATETIYNDICYPLVESVLEGYNATMFAYGQTGCGKSFTMEGSEPSMMIKIDNLAESMDDISVQSLNLSNNQKDSSGSERGIIPRALEHIFEAIAVTTEVKYLVLVSYLEIYNEQIRDLLVPSEKISTTNLPLKEVPNEGVFVQGLSTHPVHNTQECEHLLKIGSKNRIIGSTLMNQNSSRSHSIFTISIEQINRNNCLNQTSLECNLSNEHIKKGKLNLVDLAGSERQAKTGAKGDRLKEATKINLSLSALGNVISALVDGKSKHIPYRDSKLTRLLQDSLGGNTKTLMIACISPADNNYDETLSTLRYANRAKNIHNQPKINEDPKDAMLRKYQEEIQKLKEMLQNNTPTNTGNDLMATLTTARPTSEEYKEKLELEKKKIISEYQEEMNRLKHEHENEKIEKEHLLQEMQNLKTQYQNNMTKINLEMKEPQSKEVLKEEILKRLQIIKSSIIGGEKAHDEKLKEKRKRKKIAAEKKLNALAQALARVEQDEDRELLQDQYKDITQELQLKTEGLRKYRHRVKALEREISDIQAEFETERTDYLETIRRHECTIQLFSQIIDKMVPFLKKDCNYCDIESIKSQAVWNEDVGKWKLPEIFIKRTKLPPPGRINTSQTAPSRLDSDSDNESLHNVSPYPNKINSGNDYHLPNFNHDCDGSDSDGKGWSSSSNSSSGGTSNSGPSTPVSPTNYHKCYIDHDFNTISHKLEKSEKENLAGNYFKPRRAAQLLNESNTSDGSKAFNIWRGMRNYAQKNHTVPSSADLTYDINAPPTVTIGSLSSSWNTFTNHSRTLPNQTLTNLWINGDSSTSSEIRKPLRLESLPTIEKRNKNKLNTLDLI